MSLAETFVPRDWQAQIIGDPVNGIKEDDTKYKVVATHRKAGKTVMALMYLFMKAITFTGEGQMGASTQVKPRHGGIRVARFTYIGPTYKQAKDIAWDLLKEIIPRQCLMRKPNETNLEIRLNNRVLINIKGADKENSLRGPGLQFALLDEYDYIKPHVWDMIIRPELGFTDGGAMFIGTPNGRRQFYEVFKLGRDGVKNWKSWLLPATKPTLNFRDDTKRGKDLLAFGFLDEIKNQVTEKYYNQEYECEFQENAGTVFDRIDENTVDEFREYPESGHRYAIGFDPALREDWSAWSVIDLVDRKVKYVYRTNKIDLELLLEKCVNIFRTWTTDAGTPEFKMDTTGMGDPIYENLITKGVGVTPVKFTSLTKSEMVKSLGILLNKDEIKIPRVPWLLDELKDYTYERLPSGRYRYGAPSGKHDDGVTSLMLACYNLPPRMSVHRQNRNQSQEHYNRFTGY